MFFINNCCCRKSKFNPKYEYAKFLIRTLTDVLDLKLKNNEISLREYVDERQKHFEKLASISKQ